MIKHILTTLYNQKKKFTAVIFEQALVFIALSASLTMALDTFRSYHSPGKLDVDNVVSFGYHINSGEYYNSDGNWQQISGIAVQTMDVVKENLEKKPYVEGISECFQFAPYQGKVEDYWSDSVTFISGKKVNAHLKGTDETAETIFKPNIIQGRWFRDGERVNGLYPAVITEQLAVASEIEDPIGKTMYSRGIGFSITGIVSGIKETALDEAFPSIIAPVSMLLPTGSTGLSEELVARIKPGFEDDFANDFYMEWNRVWGSGDETEPVFSLLEQKEKDSMEDALIQTVAVGIPALFLLLFTLIGTLGIKPDGCGKKKA